MPRQTISIVTSGGSGGGGGTTIPPVPPVTITGHIIEEKEDGIWEVQVQWAPDPTATTTNFTGVKVYLEDPDLSALKLAPLNSTAKLDATSQSSGAFKPILKTDSFETPATIIVPGQIKARPIRVYLLAFGPSRMNTLRRANVSNPTPNVVMTIDAAEGTYVDGEEFAWLVTDAVVAVVEDFEHPAGPRYHLEYSYTPPDPSLPLPPGLKPFAGVQIVNVYDDGTQTAGPFLQVNKPSEWYFRDVPIGKTDHYKVAFCSQDIYGRINEVVPGVTPMVDVQVVYPPVGQATTPDVTGFTLTNSRHGHAADGSIFALADIAWTKPNSTRYSGVLIYRTAPLPVLLMGTYPLSTDSATLEVNKYPAVAETWTLAAIAYDRNGKPSADPEAALPARIPTVTWLVGPPAPGGTGQEFSQVGTPGTVTTEQQLNSDGVVMMRHKITGWGNPDDVKFGGMSIARVIAGNTADPVYWDAPKGVTALTTEWEPSPTARSWDFYFVSRSMDNKRNTLLPGVTPRVTVAHAPIAGDVVISRLPKGWWNEDEFSWPDGGLFQADQFIAKKIFVGSILRVGGGQKTGVEGDRQFAGFANGQIAVYNQSNVIRAWFGEQGGQPTPDNPSPHTVFGGWVSEFYIGGDGPPTAPIYATNTGTVIIGGWDFQGTRYPSISIRDERNLEVGRIGAKVAQGLGLPPTDPAANIAGAWFKEFAIGGQSLADWRILSRRGTTGSVQEQDLVSLRNINKFTIDYIANFPSATNPTNDAMKFEMGYDAYVADSTSNPAYWKFPGIKLSTVGSQHAVIIVQRGILMHGPDGLRRAALYTWNGQVTGNSQPNKWWGELTLSASGVSGSGSGNVLLSSGQAAAPTPVPPGVTDTATENASYFRMLDGNNNSNFSVDQWGFVIIRRGLTMGAGGGELNCSSSIKGLNVTATGIAEPNGYLRGRVCDASVSLSSPSASFGSCAISGALSAQTISVSNSISTPAITGLGTLTAVTINGTNITASSKVKGNLVEGDTFKTPSINVINSSGHFIGPEVKSTGPVSGTELKLGTVTVVNTSGAFVGNGASCPNNSILALGFNVAPNHFGQTMDVYFKHPDGTFLDLYINGVNQGAKRLKFVGGVLVGFV